MEENQCESCPYRVDKTCIGADNCLQESDDWMQQRVLAKLALSQAKGSKAAHAYFHTLKLSEGLGQNREEFLDKYINMKKKCAFEKLIADKGVADQLPDETDDPNAIFKRS
jgi:hypothetical protein